MLIPEILTQGDHRRESSSPERSRHATGDQASNRLVGTFSISRTEVTLSAGSRSPSGRRLAQKVSSKAFGAAFPAMLPWVLARTSDQNLAPDQNSNFHRARSADRRKPYVVFLQWLIGLDFGSYESCLCLHAEPSCSRQA
jgi:hypothetical protein